VQGEEKSKGTELKREREGGDEREREGEMSSKDAFKTRSGTLSASY